MNSRLERPRKVWFGRKAATLVIQGCLFLPAACTNSWEMRLGRPQNELSSAERRLAEQARAYDAVVIDVEHMRLVARVLAERTETALRDLDAHIKSSQAVAA